MKYEEYTILKKNGKTRKIVAPDEALKAYQRRQLKALEAIFYREINRCGLADLDVFHGFVHGRNVVTAAEKHIGFSYTVMMDISHFFDSVFANHINPIYTIPKELFHKEGYAAQGFPTSPMIANIAAVPVMANIVRRLDSAIKDYVITIYADDIAISSNNKDYTSIIQRIITEEFNRSGFEINPKKTRIRYAEYGFRRLLGVNVGDTSIRATRKTMRKIRAAKHQSDKGNITASRSFGGLTTWSKCVLPRQSRMDHVSKATKREFRTKYNYRPNAAISIKPEQDK